MEIMEMQCDLLVSKFKDQKTIALVKENIRHISEGSSSHCASALELGFEKAFELKMRKREPPGTKLRCSYIGCPSYDDHVSYSSIAMGAHYCQRCFDVGRCSYLGCASCGCSRTGDYASCKNCAKRFI